MLQRLALVASFTGAWIETTSSWFAASCCGVASFTGAWIETGSLSSFSKSSSWSRPSRARGSKLSALIISLLAGCRVLHGRVDRNDRRNLYCCPDICRVLHGRVDRNGMSAAARALTNGRVLHGRVDRNLVFDCYGYFNPVASFTGAWIETCPSTTSDIKRSGSRPSRARGSKLHQRGDVFRFDQSRPSRARGSKPDPEPGADLLARRVLHGRVDRNFLDIACCFVKRRRVLHGRVDRNAHNQHGFGLQSRRVLHGRVDRNWLEEQGLITLDSRVLHGRVDRNTQGVPVVARRMLSRPSRARGSKPQASF